jgi:signal recognition particle subunit SRP54
MMNSTVLDEKCLNQLINSIAVALIQSDVDVKLVKQLQTNIKAKINLEDVAAGHNKRKLIQSTVIKELYTLLDSGKAPYEPKKGQTNVIMFVGLQGSGKTTTCTKYAYYYRRKGWKTALVCADTFRAGAFDQLKQNATRANIPFYGSYTERDPVVVAESGVEQFRKDKYEIIIVDTSGRHKQEAALFEEMQEVAKVVNPQDIVFVMDSSIGQAAKDQALAFRSAVNVGSVIITKLDGHAKGGGALSAVAATHSPVIFVGTGEHIGDFEPFDTKSFVSRLLGMGDIGGLLKLFEENKMFETQPELMKKIAEGKDDFTFRDMYEQFQNLLKLGPLGKVMSMIPGFANALGPGKEAESSARIKRFMTIMDSMNNGELDSDVKLFNKEKTRIVRVARGAGVHDNHVVEVLTTFLPFQKFAKKISELSKGVDPRKMTGKNAQMNMKALNSMFTPQQIQKMGGMANMQQMMKKFGGMGMPGMGMPGGHGGHGGMPDLSSMMSMLGGGHGGMPDFSSMFG